MILFITPEMLVEVWNPLGIWWLMEVFWHKIIFSCFILSWALSEFPFFFLFIGHTGDRLNFETLSGTLIVRREGQQLVMDFPSNEATTLTKEEDQHLAQLVAASCGGVQAKEVLLCRTLKYLLIRLHDSCSRSAETSGRNKLKVHSDVPQLSSFYW